jgi:hypothetical protein
VHNHNATSSSPDPPGAAPASGADPSEAPRGHSMWWMVACCAPMVIVALALVLGLFGTR